MRKRLLRLTVAVLCVAGLLPSQAQTYDKEPATVAWDFNTQADYDKVTTLIPADGFSLATVDLGDIEVTGTSTGQATNDAGEKVTFLKLRPSGTTQAAQWKVTPARGLSFTPTKVSAYIQRFGTDAENGVTVSAAARRNEGRPGQLHRPAQQQVAGRRQVWGQRQLHQPL